MRLLLYVCAVVLSLAGCKDTNEQQGVSSNSQKLDSLKTNNPMQELNERIKKAPNNSVLYYDRAGLHLLASSTEDAINDLDRAIKLDSTNSYFYLLKGDIFFMQKKTREAKVLLDKSIELDGENIDAHLKLAEMYFYSDKYQESINSINNALGVDKFHAKAYFQKGMTYKYFGDTAKAVSSFQTAIEQNPDYYNAHIQLGLLFATVNNPLAEAYYNNALRINPTSLEVIYNKSLYLQNGGHTDKAMNGYRIMTKIDPNTLDAYYNMGFIKLTVKEDLDSALYFFNKVIELNPIYYPAYYNIGYCHELNGDKQKAKINYQATLKLKPDYDLAAYGMSRVE